MDYYLTREKLAERLKELKRYEASAKIELTGWKWKEEDLSYEEGAAVDLNDSSWEDFPRGGRWAGPDGLAWFRFHFALSGKFAGREARIRFNLGPNIEVGIYGCEALAFVNGEPRSAVDFGHPCVLLTAKAKGGKEYVVALKAWTNVARPPIGDIDHPPREYFFTVADVEAVEAGVTELIARLTALLEATDELDERNAFRQRALKLANQALRLVDFTRPGTEEFYAGCEQAAEMLADRMERELGPQGPGRVNFVGHAHIDAAWLWQKHHTRRKTVQTFTSMLDLMSRYDDFRFLQSQPVLYEWFREAMPAKYEELRERVREGRWEAEGAMWVEADTNIPSGESLVRQILYGKKFFREEFGVESRLLWLPDVFGYSAALPQILRKCGVDYFATTKLNWNRYNPPAYDVFRWRGIDGSEVIANMVGHAGGYNGQPSALQARKAWEAVRQKDCVEEVIFPFGFGDGGGGATAEHIAAVRMLTGMAGSPEPVTRPVVETLDAIGTHALELPVWVGELYFELHRGTYTTQGRTKRANRKCEFALAGAELVGSLAWLLAGRETEREKLERAWKLVLFNQFHDIIPGSSIAEVYRDADEDYRKAKILSAEDAEKSALAIAPSAEGSIEEGVLIVNPLGWERVSPVELDLASPSKDFTVLGSDGKPLAAQKTWRGTILVRTGPLPALGYQWFKLTPGEIEETRVDGLSVSTREMENRFFRVRFDEEGNLSSVFDKRAGREALAGPGGQLQFFEDKPLAWDAWDIDIFYSQKPLPAAELIAAVVVEDGPLRAAVKFMYRFRSSEFETVVAMWRDVPRIDFYTKADWQERHVLVKAAFPVRVHSPRATYEIQFGALERPTHANTSWDVARFEVAAQRWADLSEAGYGVALANDCKYGYDIRDNVMRLTLLRGPASPDPDADRGRHEFAYSLIPHEGSWHEAGVVRLAYEFNRDVDAYLSAGTGPASRKLPERFSFASVSSPAVVIETVKRPEDGADGLIVRAYEAHGGHRRATITFGAELKSAHEVDLIEENPKKLDFKGNRLELNFGPFEIKTLRVCFKR